MKKILFLIFLFPFVVNGYATSAHSVVLMDTDSKRVIYSVNKDDIRSVASTSKIMTALVAIESGKLDDLVVIGNEVLKAYGSGIYVSVGEEITLEQLLYGLMLRSGNDAALAIATYVAGNVQDFVKLMNEKAKMIGMNNTTFNNPSGLDAEKGNYSSAYDMALLMSTAMQNEEFRKIVGTKKIVVKTNLKTYEWQNKNKLLSIYKYATGGKTGYTKIAKRTLVTTASKNNVNLVAVTLVDGDDFNDHKRLFEEAFSKFENYNILNKNSINIVGEDYYKNAYFYLKNSFNYSLKSDELEKILIKYELKKINDYKSDDEVGQVKVFLNNKEIYRDKVFIKVKQEKKGFLRKIIDKLW